MKCEIALLMVIEYLTPSSKRPGLNEPLNIMSVLHEAVSIISRKSILKILQDDLIEDFRSSDTVDAYFANMSASWSIPRIETA